MSRVLVVGSGGREHALAWKLAQSSQVDHIIVAPGNPGMSSQWEYWPVSLSQGKEAFEALADRALQNRIDLAVIGPDNPLSEGIVDVFEQRGILSFGPRARAAQIEASKAFAKEVMVAAGVPTAQYWVTESEDEARNILKSLPWNQATQESQGLQNPTGWVIKADGLALGKGVRVCENLDEALQAVHSLISISGKLVIEEKLLGQELSCMAFCDGERCALLDPARDYKSLLDGNLGPNTGGMGAFSPVPGVTDAFLERIRSQVFVPTLRELKKRGAEFRGLLYAGLMVDPYFEKYWVLEFNARFGDPETQVLLPRIQDDLYTWCVATARGDLKNLSGKVPFSPESAVFVVAASLGYPDQPQVGKKIEVIDPAASLFFAGVKEAPDGKGWLTSGGRVLGALGMGKDLESARERAYLNMKKVHFEGMGFRLDIGKTK